MDLVFQIEVRAGTLGEHMRQLTGKGMTDGALAQRRTGLLCIMFEMIREKVFATKAQSSQHLEASCHWLRLCGLDGSRFSLADTLQERKSLNKANTRQSKAAFDKGEGGLPRELGPLSPIAAAIRPKSESSIVFPRHLVDRLHEKSPRISDRHYGQPALLSECKEMESKGQRWFWVHVINLKCQGSAGADSASKQLERTCLFSSFVRSASARRIIQAVSSISNWTTLAESKELKRRLAEIERPIKNLTSITLLIDSELTKSCTT